MTNMDDLNKAKEILQKEKYTFVLIKRGKLIKTSYKKGVLPLLAVINGDDQVLNKAIIADKVIGRAAALLVANYQVKAVYAGTISENARGNIDNNSVFYQFGQCVPYIKNRNQTDQCPLEKLTSSISSSDSAYEQILQFYQQVLKINI